MAKNENEHRSEGKRRGLGENEKLALARRQTDPHHPDHFNLAARRWLCNGDQGALDCQKEESTLDHDDLTRHPMPTMSEFSSRKPDTMYSSPKSLET